MAVRLVEFGDTQLRIADQTYLEDHAGAVIWDAGLVLAHYIYHSTKAIGSQPLAGQRVIEVGAGVGIVGLTAAALGAQVVLTDLAAVLPGLWQNIQDNQLDNCATAAELRWGSPVDHLQPPFDLVLASDVAYDSNALPALLSTLTALAGPHSHILFAFESRPPVTDEAVRLMPHHGLMAEEIPAADLPPGWRDPDMHVLHLTLAAEAAS